MREVCYLDALVPSTGLVRARYQSNILYATMRDIQRDAIALVPMIVLIGEIEVGMLNKLLGIGSPSG